MSTHWFNQSIDRKQDHALKWQLYPDDVLPMWIADSDYPASPGIQSRLTEYASRAVFGYQLAEHTPELNEATVNWLKNRYGWEIQADWLVWVPGVMVGVNACVSVYANNKLAVQSPNYPPILSLGKTHNSDIGLVKTTTRNTHWALDLASLEDMLKYRVGGLFVLTNPMNPGGSVYSQEELDSIGYLCDKYDIVLCSDEVHCDLILNGSNHIPAGSISSLRERSITIMSASKTFNIAGLATAYAVIPNESLRRQFYRHTVKQQFWVNPFGMQATIAAYTESDEWYQAQLVHLKQNQKKLALAIESMDGLSYLPSAATYLAWIDASGHPSNNPYQYYLDRKVALSAGVDFGDNNFLRLNFACPETMLEEVLSRMAS